jgi:hypothetical protein
MICDLPADFWVYLQAVVDYVILIPAFLFWEELYGPGWRSSTRWLV